MMNATVCRKTIIFLSVFGVILGVTAIGIAAAHASANSAAPPNISDVNPNELPNATNMYITVTGDNFVPTPTLMLGTVSLRDVTFVDGQTLTALVPWGLPPGSYTLTVVNPDGQSGAKENAILVYQEDTDWESNGPYGGLTADVFIDPQNRSRIYASASGSGLFMSSDAAENWRPVYLGTMLTDLVFQYYNGGRHLYLGKDNGLIHSADDGLTWELFLPDEVGSWTGNLNFHPAWNPLEPQAVYLGVSGRPGPGGADAGGLFKYSYQTGKWTRLYLHDLHVTSVAFSPVDPNRIYFGTREGQFYASSDGGITWADPVTVSNQIGRVFVDPFPNSLGEYNIYVTTIRWGYPGGEGRTYRSQDGGLTFQRIDNLPHPNAGVHHISFHPVISGVIWLAAGNYGYFTTDNGQSWSISWSAPEPHREFPYVWGFALAPDPSDPDNLARMTVYAATDGGVYKSVDGGQTWQASNQGLAGLMLGSLGVNPQNPDEAYASPMGMSAKFIKTIDGGRNWQPLNIPAPWVGWGGPIVVDPFTPNVVYFPAICEDPCFYISSDRGATYQVERLPRPEGVPDDAIGNGVMVASDPEQPGRLLAGAIIVPEWNLDNAFGVLYIRESAGADWQIVKVLPEGRLWRIYFDPHNPQRVYAATNAGLYRSQNRGETWDRLTPGNFRGIDLVIVHPDHADVIYIHKGSPPEGDQQESGIYVSRDDGATWNLLTDESGHNVYGGPMAEMIFAPIGPRVFYIATWDGLFQSLDGGRTIALVGGLPWGPVHSLASGHDVGLNSQQRLVMYVGAAGGYRINLSFHSNMNRAAQTDLMSPGVYRRVITFHLIYLPVVRR